MKYDAAKSAFMRAARFYRALRMRAVGKQGNFEIQETTVYRRESRSRWGRSISFSSTKIEGAYARSEAIFNPNRAPAASGGSGGPPPERSRIPPPASPPSPLQRMETGTTAAGEVTVRMVSRVEFDAAPIATGVNRAARRILMRVGAFIRQIARSSIVTRDGTSPPGHAPYGHAGHLRRLILFAYNAVTKSVTVGPTLFGSAQDPPVPAVLEYGGPTRIGTRDAFIEARPYMGPAQAKVMVQFPSMWADSVHA